MVFLENENILKVRENKFNSTFKTYYLIIIGTIFSVLSNLILFFTLIPKNKNDFLMEMVFGLTLVVAVLSIAYFKYKLTQKFFLIFLLILASSYTSFFTSFGIKLVSQDPFINSYHLLIIIFLGINILGFIFVITYFLNKYVIFPLNYAIENSIEVKNLLETQKNELSNFSHTMAHDLRSGLTNIKLYLDLLIENDPESEYIEKINQQLINVDDLMNKSVKLADQGLIIGVKSLVNLRDIINEISEITLSKDTSLRYENIVRFIYCDREKISQVLKNIFENATRHSKPKTITINVKISKDSYIVQIINDGQPFDKLVQNQFNKKINTLTRSKPLGLGLIIIKRIILAHGWNILITDLNPPTIQIFIPKSDVKTN